MDNLLEDEIEQILIKFNMEDSDTNSSSDTDLSISAWEVDDDTDVGIPVTE
jgi:hypothetical protein